jgi:KDO2-lipid IV(A) lauroyltransferase
MPFFLLYGLSNVVSFFLYRILGYRKKVVRENLKTAFPEKSEKALKKIEKDFYLNLSDILLESIKGYTMGEKSARKRYYTEDEAVINNLLEKGKSVIITMAHLANWEWGTNSIPLFVEKDIFVVYKPINNHYIDQYVKKSRSKNGMTMLPLNKTQLYFQKFAKKPSSIILVSDQNPSNPKRAVWVDFLGKKTAFLHGIEYYSRTYNMPVVYLSVQRIKRGHYRFNIQLLHENPKELKPGEITQLYASKLEEEIKKNPADWVWSHKRWKHRWEDHNKKAQV